MIPPVGHRVTWVVLVSLIVPAAALTHARGQGPAAAKRPAEFTVVVEKDLKIAMRDGVRLAADIYRPARGGKPAEGRFPAFLTRTPYDKNGAKSGGRVLCVAGIRRGGQRRPRPVRQRGDLAADRRRPAGRLRGRRVDRPPGVVRRQGRHVRHQLSRGHPARAGGDESAPSDHDGPDRRGVELRRQRDAARRGVRAAVHELDLPDRGAQQPGGAGQSRAAAVAGRERPADPRARRQPAGPAGQQPAAAWSRNTRRGWSRRCGAAPSRRSGTSRGCRSSTTSASTPTSRSCTSPAGTTRGSGRSP